MDFPALPKRLKGTQRRVGGIKKRFDTTSQELKGCKTATWRWDSTENGGLPTGRIVIGNKGGAIQLKSVVEQIPLNHLETKWPATWPDSTHQTGDRLTNPGFGGHQSGAVRELLLDWRGCGAVTEMPPCPFLSLHSHTHKPKVYKPAINPCAAILSESEEEEVSTDKFPCKPTPLAAKKPEPLA
ncbi:hypothetical protein CEXT_36131 [Caerostris extrusa]|uniref:Uncharacterized protein n=1 Tax=Caerostris extrusa TaxID=172846 RepID=A0AAV4MG83_CAEEX|nr:hypothetical protein CEXT_36131 [Caerostris extrusa]